MELPAHMSIPGRREGELRVLSFLFDSGPHGANHPQDIGGWGSSLLNPFSKTSETQPKEGFTLPHAFHNPISLTIKINHAVFAASSCAVFPLKTEMKTETAISSESIGGSWNPEKELQRDETGSFYTRGHLLYSSLTEKNFYHK